MRKDEGAGCAGDSGEEVVLEEKEKAEREGGDWERYSLTSFVVCGLPTRTWIG